MCKYEINNFLLFSDNLEGSFSLKKSKLGKRNSNNKSFNILLHLPSKLLAIFLEHTKIDVTFYNLYFFLL